MVEVALPDLVILPLVRERRRLSLVGSPSLPTAFSRTPALSTDDDERDLNPLHPSVQAWRLGTILLISGDRDSRISFTRIAKRWREVRLTVEEGAKAGMTTAIVDRPQLVVLDSELPDAEGLWLVDRIRGSASCATTPIVVLGLDSSGREERQFCAIGADAYLTKPLNIEAVGRIVLGLLEVAVQRRAERRVW